MQNRDDGREISGCCDPILSWEPDTLTPINPPVATTFAIWVVWAFVDLRHHDCGILNRRPLPEDLQLRGTTHGLGRYYCKTRGCLRLRRLDGKLIPTQNRHDVILDSCVLPWSTTWLVYDFTQPKPRESPTKLFLTRVNIRIRYVYFHTCRCCRLCFPRVLQNQAMFAPCLCAD